MEWRVAHREQEIRKKGRALEVVMYRKGGDGEEEPSIQIRFNIINTSMGGFKLRI